MLKRRHDGENRAQRQVGEHVKARVVHRQQFRDPVQHLQPALRASSLASSASTTRSSRLTREPLTSSRTSALSAASSARASSVGVAIALGAGAEGVGSQGRERAEAVEPFHAERAGQLAGLAVARRGELAELGHVAEHHPAPTRQLAQHLERGAHRARIGVVRVIDEPGAVRCATQLQSPADRLHLRQTRWRPAPDWRRR